MESPHDPQISNIGLVVKTTWWMKTRLAIGIFVPRSSFIHYLFVYLFIHLLGHINFIRKYVERNATQIFNDFGKPALATLRQHIPFHLNTYNFCLQVSNGTRVGILEKLAIRPISPQNIKAIIYIHFKVMSL